MGDVQKRDLNILTAILGYDSLTGTEIADILGINPESLYKKFRELEDKDLINKQTEDRYRSVGFPISLTDRGHRIAEYWQEIKDAF